MDDLISRQAAIDMLRCYLVGKRCPDDGTLTCRLIENEVINKLPPAPPAQPGHIKGHWTVKEGELAFWDVCSVCRKMIIHRAPHYSFCPNCGADMREVTE